MSASGIGRGRGWLNINKNQNIKPGTATVVTNTSNYENAAPVAAPKLNYKYSNILTKIDLFDENDDGILMNQKLKYIIDEFIKDCPSSSDVEEAFEDIYAYCLQNSEFAAKAICVVSTASFHTVVIKGHKLRNLFITQFQKDFENCKELQNSNPNTFRNVVKMLGDFYHKARLSNGKPIMFLSTPVLQYLNMLLDSTNEQDLQVFAVQMFMNGGHIKEDLRERLAETFIKVRKILATNDRLSTNSKLWLLMALDISCNRFGLFPNELQQFYSSQLGDPAMAQIKKLNTELCIETTYQSLKLDMEPSNVNVLQPVTSSAINWDMAKAGATSKEDKTVSKEVSSKSSNKTPRYNNTETGFNNIGTWEQPKTEKTPRPILGVGARLKKHQEESNWNERKGDDWEEENSNLDNKKKDTRGKWGTGSDKPRKNVSKGWEHDDRTENDYN